VQLLEQVLREQGPFDGLVGFSQVGAVARVAAAGPECTASLVV
jgi:hypothetical protein